MRLILIIPFLLIVFYASSQKLTGEWKGYYTYNKGDFLVPEGKTIISIIIDSAINVRSYTKYKNDFNRDTLVSKKMSMEKIGINKFKLAELGDSSTKNDVALQTMILNFKQQKPPILSGKWEACMWEGTYAGNIILVRQERKKK
jgi:hypothetical protein